MGLHRNPDIGEYVIDGNKDVWKVTRLQNTELKRDDVRSSCGYYVYKDQDVTLQHLFKPGLTKRVRRSSMRTGYSGYEFLKLIEAKSMACTVIEYLTGEFEL